MNLKKSLSDLRNRRICDKDRKRYIGYMKLNGISNTAISGEKEWMKKWSVLGIKPSIEYYRFFSHYIGESSDIIPEAPFHLTLEKVLNPIEYSFYYSDKNIYDKLFPDGYLPATICRRFCGILQSSKYEPLSLKEVSALLGQIQKDRVIIKPTVDTQSGRNVLMAKKMGGGYFMYK